MKKCLCGTMFSGNKCPRCTREYKDSPIQGSDGGTDTILVMTAAMVIMDNSDSSSNSTSDSYLSRSSYDSSSSGSSCDSSSSGSSYDSSSSGSSCDSSSSSD